MTQYFFKVPFASSGDVSTIPLPAQGSGSVSFTEGFPPDYQADPSDPNVLYPQRQTVNEILLLITQAIQILQVHGYPDWITSADNGGSPYSYNLNSFVRYSDGNIYVSIVSSNTSTPGTDPTKWALFNPFPTSFYTGMMIPHEDVTVPAGGWIWANGLTVGNASSNATGRANADAQALFTQIWNAFPNSVRPMVDSTGTPVGSRGANAAADWAANRALPVRDMRDVVLAGTGTMGGTTNRGLLTGYRQGVDGSVYGSTGGEQAHTPIIDETAAHTHVQNAGDNAPMYPKASGAGNSTDNTGKNTLDPLQTQSTGGGSPFNVVQPTTIGNWIIKL